MKIEAFGRVLAIEPERVNKNMDTHRLIVRTLSRETRKTDKMILMVGTSKDKTGKRKFFIRTGLLEGLRFSAGKIREQDKKKR